MVDRFTALQANIWLVQVKAKVAARRLAFYAVYVLPVTIKAGQAPTAGCSLRGSPTE